jgi:Tol biopolymer transport system component
MTEPTDVREFLRTVADEVAFVPVEPRPAIRRAKRRLMRTLTVATLVVAAIAVGSVVGIGRLTAAPPSLPAHPGPSVLPTYHHNGDIAFYGVVSRYDRPCARSASDTTGVPVERGCGIFEVDPATGHEAPLQISGIGMSGKEKAATGLTWSPDGMALAYELDGKVSIFHLSTGRSEDILRCPPQPRFCELAWSPDGTTIAVSHGDTIDLVTPKGDRLTSLEPLGPGADIGAPAWLPDGRRIAFVGRGSGLYEVDRTGAHLRHLGDIPKGAYAPAFSPDGSRIAYFMFHKCSSSFDTACPLTLTVAPTDGSSAEAVRAVGKCACVGINPGLGWSPDGKKLVLQVPKPGSPFVMNADGTGLRSIHLESVDLWGDPAWRPVP